MRAEERAEQKALLRARFIGSRRARPADDVAMARAGIRAAVIARCVEDGWRCVAAYEPLSSEPGSRELLAGLHGLGSSVLVPRLLADKDLDWVHWHPDEEWPRAPLGLEAIGAADAIVVPALAVALDGTRLGRGGGSYDRALARASHVPIVALLYPDELVAELPGDEWDRPVTAVVTPAGWTDLPAGAPE
jgi:5-formyltetrahydrofolate cyclo-ligase